MDQQKKLPELVQTVMSLMQHLPTEAGLRKNFPHMDGCTCDREYDTVHMISAVRAWDYDDDGIKVPFSNLEERLCDARVLIFGGDTLVITVRTKHLRCFTCGATRQYR